MTQEENEFYNNSTQMLASEKEQRILRNYHLVDSFLDSDVYNEVIGPHIDDAINSVNGFKSETDGLWHAGAKHSDKHSQEKLHYLIGYQTALIELSASFRQFIRLGERVANKMEGEPQEEYNSMLDDLEESED